MDHLLPTGQLWAWGQNASGQVGSGSAGSDVLSSQVVLTGINAGAGIPWSVRAPQPATTLSGIGHVVRRADVLRVHMEKQNRVFVTA